MTPILSVATSTAIVSAAVDQTGANITGLLVILGLAIGIPLSFKLFRYVRGLFPGSGRRRRGV